MDDRVKVERSELLHAIHDWIRDDVPLAGKMNLMPKHADALIDKIAARASDTGRSEAEVMAKLLSGAEPTISRQGNDITLQCPDGTITDEIYDALEAACYGDHPSPTPQGQGERKSDG